MERRFSTKDVARVAVLAAVYALLTLFPPLAGISYGPVQIRVAEALTVLPFAYPWAVWGLYLGCVLSNLGSPFLVWDIGLGATGTLVAALLTRRMPKAYLAPLPPILVNAFLVSSYLSYLLKMPYWLVVLYVGAGQTIACYVLGYPLLLYILRTKLI